MARVTVMNLQCQQTYTITAGGILSNGMLVEPQFSAGVITAGSCSTTPTPTLSPSVGKSIYVYSWTYVSIYYVRTYTTYIHAYTY